MVLAITGMGRFGCLICRQLCCLFCNINVGLPFVLLGYPTAATSSRVPIVQIIEDKDAAFAQATFRDFDDGYPVGRALGLGELG